MQKPVVLEPEQLTREDAELMYDALCVEEAAEARAEGTVCFDEEIDADLLARTVGEMADIRGRYSPHVWEYRKASTGPGFERETVERVGLDEHRLHPSLLA